MNPVVEVSHLRKRFRLPLDKSSTLKYRVTHLRSSSRYRDLVAFERRLLRHPVRAIPRHRRPERMWQEHAAQDSLSHLQSGLGLCAGER